MPDGVRDRPAHRHEPRAAALREPEETATPLLRLDPDRRTARVVHWLLCTGAGNIVLALLAVMQMLLFYGGVCNFGSTDTDHQYLYGTV